MLCIPTQHFPRLGVTICDSDTDGFTDKCGIWKALLMMEQRATLPGWVDPERIARDIMAEARDTLA